MLANGAVSTTDEYTGHHGGVGICLETGQARDMALLPRVRGAVLHLLESQLGLALNTGASAFADADQPPPHDEQEHYKLVRWRASWVCSYRGFGESVAP